MTTACCSHYSSTFFHSLCSPDAFHEATFTGRICAITKHYKPRGLKNRDLGPLAGSAGRVCKISEDTSKRSSLGVFREMTCIDGPVWPFPPPSSVPGSLGAPLGEPVLLSLESGTASTPFQLPQQALLLSRCLEPSLPQPFDSAKASMVLERHSSSPSPHS